MAKSKFFRVAVEGATADGRTIERQQLVEMAASYNPATYAARVNMEHIRGVTADKPFKAYGDVIALKTEEIELDLDGQKQKRLALFAQIDPTDDLLAINKDRQKMYSSIEINPNFAATGKAYLMGIATTDSPASLGTEMLQFVAGQREKGIDPFAARRLSPDNLFTAAMETAFELEDEGTASVSSDTALFAGIKRFFESFGAGQPPKGDDKHTAPAPPPPPANDNGMAAFAVEMAKFTGGMESALDKLSTDIAGFNSRLGKVEQMIDTTPQSNHRQRPSASGKTFATTDC